LAIAWVFAAPGDWLNLTDKAQIREIGGKSETAKTA
jgi:hypothetical protein